jgi:transcriptional regulator with XRE-family HTH domain
MTSMVTPMDAFAEAIDDQSNARSPSNVRIGNRVRIGRVSHGLSEREFSDQLRIGRDDLNLYESGGKRVSANLMFRIAKLLDVQLEYFFQDYEKAEL